MLRHQIQDGGAHMDTLMCTFQSLYSLLDELIDEVELGACYSFSLIPFREFHGSQNSAQLDLVFEANNVIKIRQFPLTPPLSLSSQPEADASTSLPLFNTVKYKFRKIYDLYKDRETSPWSFTVGLSHFFGDSISPPGTYQRLKLGILLSLVSQQSPSKEEQPSTSQGNLNILVVSKDILPIQRLFLFSKSFTSRSAIFSPCNDLCYSISKDPLNIGSCMIHAGCLPLANNGVCVLTNLNELKSDQMEELKNVLQIECVSVEVPKKYIGCQQSLILMPVRCKIWACCETTKKEGIRTHHNAYQNLPDNGRLSKALVDHFSLVFIIGDNNEMSSRVDSTHDQIVEDVLKKASLMKKESKYRIADAEFFEFIQYISTSHVTFTERAQELIQGFYLSSRRVRSSSGQGGAEFPITALKAMMSLAEAHARLRLRTKVSEDDAVLAIMLYEESITARVGYSVLGLSSNHHFTDGSTTSLSESEDDERMVQLKIHMKRFCSLHSHYKYTPGHIAREE